MVTWGGHARPAERQLKARMANSGVEFLGRGQQALAAPAGNLEECCKLPRGVRGGARLKLIFMYYLAWKWSLVATILTKNFQITL